MSANYSVFLQWLNTHPEYACYATFTIATAESVAIIGTIIPGTVTMTAIGGLAGAGIIPLWSTLFLAMLGAIVGDGISYWMGYHLRDRLHLVWPFKTRPEAYATARHFVKSHGGKSVFFGRFIGPIRALIPLVAGSFGMAPWRFLIANILSAILWAPAYMLPGILLGALALELPPDLAIRLIGVCFISVCGIMSVLWIAKWIFAALKPKLDHYLNMYWRHALQSQALKNVSTVLHSHEINAAHGQLGRGMVFCFLLCVFIYLCYFVNHHTLATVPINETVYHFFRLFHFGAFDEITIWIAQLGEKFIILPVAFSILLWLLWDGKKRIACYWSVLIVSAIILTALMQHLLKIAPPWGILQNQNALCFPSTHIMLISTWGIGILQLTNSRTRSSLNWVLQCCVIFLIFSISLACLYLGMHWFSDILGSLLLAFLLNLVFCIAVERQESIRVIPSRISLLSMLLFILAMLLSAKHNVDLLRKEYSTIEWPPMEIPINAWWSANGDQVPLYRKKIHADATDLLSIQWLGKLYAIKQVLAQQGFTLINESAWTKIFNDLFSTASQHLPLLAPRFLDEEPAITMIRRLDQDDTLVIWLWDSHITMQGSGLTLWVGTLSRVPYGNHWIQHVTPEPMNPKLIFIHSVVGWMQKTIPLSFSLFKNVNIRQQKTLMLIKPIGYDPPEEGS